MYLYLLKKDKRELFANDNEEVTSPSVLLVHEDKFTQEEFQRQVSRATLDMGHYPTFKQVIQSLKKYGFEEVVTGYYNQNNI